MSKQVMLWILTRLRQVGSFSYVYGRARRFVLLSLCGALLLACVLQAEYLVLPESLDGLSRPLYRVAFLFIAPFRVLVSLFIPRVDHHWPFVHLAVSALGAPFFLWFCVQGILRVHRVAMRRRSQQRSHHEAPTFERRQFLVKSMAGMGLATGLGAYASHMDMDDLRVQTYEVPIRGLAPALNGLRILHVSDTHYGPYTGLDFLERVAERANRLHPDLVLFTGDYVHLTPLSIEAGIDILSAFSSRFGSLAVLGNHEHWEGVRACRNVFERIQLPLTDNSRMFLTPAGLKSAPDHGASLCIAGVGDLWEDKVDFAAALSDLPADMPRLVLSHNPDAAEYVGRKYRVDLMLSGHTHGGQINLPLIGPPGSGSRHGRKYLGGLCKGPYCPVIVSRGVGMAFIPLRFRVPPELGLITLAGCC